MKGIGRDETLQDGGKLQALWPTYALGSEA